MIIKFIIYTVFYFVYCICYVLSEQKRHVLFDFITYFVFVYGIFSIADYFIQLLRL